MADHSQHCWIKYRVVTPLFFKQPFPSQWAELCFWRFHEARRAAEQLQVLLQPMWLTHGHDPKKSTCRGGGMSHASPGLKFARRAQPTAGPGSALGGHSPDGCPFRTQNAVRENTETAPKVGGQLHRRGRKCGRSFATPGQNKAPAPTEPDRGLNSYF